MSNPINNPKRKQAKHIPKIAIGDMKQESFPVVTTVGTLPVVVSVVVSTVVSVVHFVVFFVDVLTEVTSVILEAVTSVVLTIDCVVIVVPVNCAVVVVTVDCVVDSSEIKRKISLFIYAKFFDSLVFQKS